MANFLLFKVLCNIHEWLFSPILIKRSGPKVTLSFAIGLLNTLLRPLIASLLVINYTYASPLQSPSNISVTTKQQRIVTLSPHLTEIAFALGVGPNVVAVSDYSDYPQSASNLPSVASFQGVNIADIVRLAPTHILAWQGGNKQQDIIKLRNLGFDVYASSPKTVDDLAENILQIGDYLGVSAHAKHLATQLNNDLHEISTGLEDHVWLSAAYIMNLSPLSGAGKDLWINSLLAKCRLKNIYGQALSSYIQLSMADLLRQSPEVVIGSDDGLPDFLRPHDKVFAAHTVVVNPDALHRFTPRVIPELKKLCLKRQSF